MLERHSTQKLKLRAALINEGWEIMDTAEGNAWDIDEEWRIQSRREDWGLELRIVFRIWDFPEWDVALIEAFRAFDAVSLASMSYRRHFDAELPAFVEALNRLRRAGA